MNKAPYEDLIYMLDTLKAIDVVRPAEFIHKPINQNF